MVFIGGPRQVGKTTLARAILDDHFQSGRYFNWDFDEDRWSILKKRWRKDHRLLCNGGDVGTLSLYFGYFSA